MKKAEEIKEATEEVTRIVCDRCGESFLAQEVVVKKESFKKIDAVFFTCPSCNYNYPFLLEDSEHREYTKAISAIQQEIAAKKRLNKPVSAAKLRQLNLLFDTAKAHQTDLRDRYIEAVTTLLNQSGHNETSS